MKLISILTGKCPQCNEGDVFSSKGNLIMLQIPQMNTRCKKCNLKFEKEPGFFFGAMFVSYGLAVGEIIGFFVISYVIFGVPLLVTFFGITLVAILCGTLNFRLSRMIWMNLFYKKE